MAAVKDNIVTLDYGSMWDVSAKVSPILDPSTGQPRFTPAGIPENSTLYGDKPKLQDKQYYQQVDLASAGLDSGYVPSAMRALLRATGCCSAFTIAARGKSCEN